MVKRLSFFLVALFFCGSLFATDLKEIYQEALVNDPQYASSKAALMAGQEKSVQGLATLLPQIEGSAAYSRNKYEGIPHNSTSRYVATLSQVIWDWGKIQNYEKSKLSVAVSEADFATAQQDLMIRVAQAYFDVLTAQDVLVFAQSQKVAIAEQLESAKRSFEVGTTTITDVHEAQARYDLADAQEYAAKSDLEVKRFALQQIIGRFPDYLAPLQKGVNVAPPQPNQMETWVSFAERQNYTVTADELKLEMAKKDISIQRAGHYPTVNLTGSYTKNNHDTDVRYGNRSYERNKSGSVGVQLNVPLFSGGAISSRVRESIALEDKARNDLVASRRKAAQLAREAFLGLNSGLSQIRALEAAEISSISALESNKLGYEVGVRINIDVLNAEQQVFSTRRDLSQARHAAIINALKLKYAAGILNENDIDEVNALLKK